MLTIPRVPHTVVVVVVGHALTWHPYDTMVEKDGAICQFFSPDQAWFFTKKGDAIILLVTITLALPC